MNPLIYKGGLRASPSLMGLNEWQEKEKASLNCAVDEEGCLLDNLTLELRVHPPEVHIDNAGDPHSTLVTIDSANRPGSLVFVSCSFQNLKPESLFSLLVSPFSRSYNTLPSSACASIAQGFPVTEAGFTTVRFLHPSLLRGCALLSLSPSSCSVPCLRSARRQSPQCQETTKHQTNAQRVYAR